MDSLHARLNSHLEVWSYVKKKRKNIKAYKKSVRKEVTIKRYLLILDLMAIQIIGQRKGFCWQITPGSSKARKETVDIGILVTSRNVEPVQPVPINICQSITYRKGLSWLHFHNESTVSANPSFLKDFLEARHLQQQTHPFLHKQHQCYQTSQAKPAEFFNHGNQKSTFFPSPQCLTDQIQVKKPILVVATDQMSDHTQSRKQYYQHRQQCYK